MKREAKKHLQKYCDISNWCRMGKPRRGKENYEAAKELYEDILRLCVQREKGEDGTAVVLAALAMVRSLVRNAVAWSPAFDPDCPRDVRDEYEKLFAGEGWMSGRDDSLLFDMVYFFRGEESPFKRILDV